MLANNEKLPEKYKDHALKNMGGVRDCHIQPDWIPLYEYFDNILVLVLNRLGTHSELSL